MRIGIVVGCSAVLVASGAFAPVGLRQMGSFQVRRVQVHGVRHLPPEVAVEASGISSESNLFDDPTPWVESLRQHPLVAEASIERRMPGTLVIHVRETRPVAFARTPELRAIDEDGRILPADPSAEGMDLPVLAMPTRVSADGRATDPETLRVVRFLGELGRIEPGLLGWISEVNAHGDAVRLTIRSAADADVLITAEPTPGRLRELHLTLADLATPRLAPTDDPGRTADGGPELSRVRRIDGRFHDQIVVSLRGGRN
ncbi:MAG TPA: FtsQ-type POTRA domain-containing protein [Longimicrobiales bacterium]|nr:FtsQ-type POTRA domain-containing protein [Longimicrobiales bacterium]